MNKVPEANCRQRIGRRVAERQDVKPTTMSAYTKCESLDDADFVAWVERVIENVERRFATDQSYVVKIDNWFGQRWLGFSGKTLGALGVRKSRLTLPPFVPSRVLSQRRFFQEGARSTPHRKLALWQRSGQNLQRYVDVAVHDASVFWYSGGTAENGRGSLMAYVLTSEGHWPWYVGLRRTDGWRVVETVGIPRRELNEIQELSGEHAAAADERRGKSELTRKITKRRRS